MTDAHLEKILYTIMMVAALVIIWLIVDAARMLVR